MLPILITAITVIAIIILWIFTKQQKLVILEEDIGAAMYQIGIRLSNRLDTLMALLDLTTCYAENESKTLLETVKSGRRVITANSTPDDVLHQESVICEALSRISVMVAQYPELKADQTYIRTMEAMQNLDVMVYTGLLIYNDRVAKLNRSIQVFPFSLFVGML